MIVIVAVEYGGLTVAAHHARRPSLRPTIRLIVLVYAGVVALTAVVLALGLDSSPRERTPRRAVLVPPSAVRPRSR